MAYRTSGERVEAAEVTGQLGWEEREVLVALKRLAAARAQLASAEAEFAVQADRHRRVEAAARPVLDAAEEAHLVDVHDELVRTRLRSNGRFRRAARQRVAELEATEALVCDRLGFVGWEDYEAFVANGRRRPGSQDVVLDLAYVEFARAELRAAERAWAELHAAVQAVA